MISARPITPESGRPAAIDFATVIRSGSTPKCSIANILPGAAEAGLHLVGDEHDPVSVADRAQPFHERARRGDEAALALQRLDHDRGDVLRRDVRLEQPLERARAPRRRSARGTRPGTARGRPRARTARAPPCTGASSRSSSSTAACARGSAPSKRDHGRPPGVQARANLTAFSTASVPALKNAACVSPGDRRERAEPLGERHVRLVRDDREVGVEEPRRLLLRPPRRRAGGRARR